MNTNPSIQCSVDSCAHHAKGQCTLSQIRVGCTQQNVADCGCTQCVSFQLGDHGTSCGCR